MRNHCYVTTAGSVLTIVNYTGTLSLTVVDATTARVDITGATWSGWAFQPHHEGRLLYLTAPSYTLLARVKPHGYVTGASVLVDTTGATVTAQTSVAGTVTVPAVDTTQPVTNKVLIIEGMGKAIYWPALGGGRLSDPVTPYGVQTWFTKTIASFTAPNQITITGSFPFNWTAQSSVVMWGTDDSAAAILCGLDVWPNKRRVWFSGDGLYLLPLLTGSTSGRPNYGTPAAGNPAPLMNGSLWYGDSAQVYAMTQGGERLPCRVSPVWAPRYNDVRKTVHGRLSFPRCAQIPAGQPINVLFDGDSLGSFNPQGQVSLVMGATRFIAEFIQQNPGKQINFYNIGVGGAGWASIASQLTAYNSATGNPYKYFTIPKPISGTVKHIDFWSNINRTGSGSAIVPDLVVMFCNGGNDGLNADVASMQAVINQIRNVSHGDAYGPTDVVMQTDQGAGGLFYSSGVSGGSALPGPMSGVLSNFYCVGINRTVALNMGFPLIDYAPLESRAAHGYDPNRRSVRQVPQVTFTPTVAGPVSFGEECLDFSFFISLPSANEAAGWAALRQMDIQLSPHPGNRLMLRLGPNGNIWAASSTVGLYVDTVVTCAPASHTITLGAATSYTANVTFRTGWPQADSADSSMTFTAAMQGKCIIANTGNNDGVPGRPQQRNWISTYIDAQDVMVHQRPADDADVSITAANPILIGPNQFVEQDNRAQPDVSIIFPDGTIWGSRVAYGGYTSATQATLIDFPPQALTAQTVSLFLGRLGMQWFDTGIKPSASSSTGYVTVGVSRGEVSLGYLDVASGQVPQTFVQRTLERFGGAYNPVIFVQGTQQITLLNRWIDEDIPIAASMAGWYQRGFNDPNSDYFTGGVGGHYGGNMRAAVLDTLYAHQNLSVN